MKFKIIVMSEGAVKRWVQEGIGEGGDTGTYVYV